MRFGLLGPLTVVTDDGADLNVPQFRQRALLSVMLLHSNRPLGPARLASLLWEEPEGLGDGALRTLIWTLRRRLGLAGRVQWNADGYRLEVRGGELDLDEFRETAAQGREVLASGHNSAAASLFGRALRLWREPPLVDLPATMGMQQIAESLLEERLAATESLIEARLALGQHRDLPATLRAQLSLTPGHEKLWEQLMLALYRSGRRAEALAAFTQVRAMLAVDYGLVPGPGLQALHRQILTDDPALMPSD
jgi:DNA-binding SARP family transcriptional activator